MAVVAGGVVPGAGVPSGAARAAALDMPLDHISSRYSTWLAAARFAASASISGTRVFSAGSNLAKLSKKWSCPDSAPATKLRIDRALISRLYRPTSRRASAAGIRPRVQGAGFSTSALGSTHADSAAAQSTMFSA
ncbi:hypothetical protein AZA_86765 [Nitrospirillum viridazoti Y2]|nr:hypothetical protein AZA_86765 [Nitrospirillum amazonense Y2]